jgi:hypothetical protein
MSAEFDGHAAALGGSRHLAPVRSCTDRICRWALLALLAGAHARAEESDPSATSAPDSLTAPQPEAPIPSPEELEAAGAVIGTITINNENIFDLSDPRENKSLYRLANRLHIRTRQNVIREQLLFKPGDRYSKRILEESERVLRATRYLFDAVIVPVRRHDGAVDVEVTTRDVWTLNPGVSFGRKGGKSTTGVQLEEVNLMGTGIALFASRESDVDRDSTSFQLKHPHLFDGHTLLDTTYSDNSDGHGRWLKLDRPFYALDTRWAAGATASDGKLIQDVYDEGHTRAKYRRTGSEVSAYGGLSNGLVGGWVQRWTFGATYDDRRYDAAPDWTGTTVIPEDRKFVYPWIGFEVLQDEFQKFRNRDQIGRTEDFFLGTRFSGRLGWAETALGSTRNAWMFSAQASHAVQASEQTTLLFATELKGRLSGGEFENTVLKGGARYYVQQSSKALFYAMIDGAVGQRIDLDEQLLLGGDTGLRGYPLRYQSGTARALLTLEQRYFTDWYPWRLFRIGGAAFFDMGRTWGQSPLGTDSRGLLKDIGVGLRIGNSRSGLGNVIHVDVAMPLDRGSSIDKVQINIETLEKF